MCETRFFICKHCGNLVGKIFDSGVSMICCGDEMTELIPGTTDASLEKHVPVITVSGNIVTVEIGSIPHPMEEAHYIQWVYIQSKKGGQRKCLNPGEAPKVSFALTEDDEVLAAYEYCNLHGLWKAEA
ncbi:MAG: desulfoferrodoxin [Clostridiales bacterium]|nr:desulfoferrodoxin [Clostridiales bacterium]